MNLRLAAAGAILAAAPALAVETTQWPPPEEVGSRMRELQQVIIARDSTLPQREAAREELSGLLKSPAGQARGRTAGEKRVARAAIEPYLPVVAPVNIAPPAPPPSGGVARMEVIEPPKSLLIPRSGAATTPSGRFAVDPRTGNVLHETLGGYIDARTGQFIPR